MAVFTEILPPTKSSKNNCFTWDNGELTIYTGRRVSVTYRVREFPCGWDGRAFEFEKLTSGTDLEAESYAVFCGRNGQDKSCECKGFLMTGMCKHLAAAESLIANGWLGDARTDIINPERDVENTEAPF